MAGVRDKLVSIVIRSFNEDKFIEKLFRGILEQTYKNVEIIIVDSGSTDRTLEIAGKYSVKVIRIDPNEFTFGFSLNKGCEAATGEYIVIASAHVYPVYKDWLETMVELLEDESVGLVYGKQRGGRTSKYSERQVFKKWFPEEPDYNQSHTFCNNANAAIKKQLWLEHPYDEKLTGLEDVAWAVSIHHLGMRIVYEPRAEVIHLHNETYERVFTRYKREAIALKQIYKEQHFNFLDFISLCSVNILSDWFHAMEDKCLLNQFVNIARFRFAQFWGTYRGYKEKSDITNELRRMFYYPKSYRFKDRANMNKPDESSAIKY